MSPFRRVLVQAAAAAALACAMAALAGAAHAAPATASKKKAARPVAAATTPAPAAQPAADPALESWKLARALADQERHAEALGVIETALHDDPDNTDLLWLQASVTGDAGRNRDAVAMYERLMVRHPELARDLRSDLATQRLWAGDAAGAVRDFDLRLQEEPSDREARKMHALALSHADRLTESLAEYDRLLAESPNDLDLQLNHARVLGWMGRNAQAAEAYREILKQHPGETQATLGAAQNENWAGNHRRAAALYEELLKSGRTDPEISKGLAYAYYWDGRPEESRTALDRYLAQQPADREGLELARMLSRDGSPNFSAGYQRSDDSDALRIRTTQFEYRMPLRGHATLFARWRRDLVKDAGGNRDPLQVGGGLDKVWSPRWSTQLYLAWLRPERDVDADAVGELNVTLRPGDRVRIDAGFAKDQVLTRLSLAEGIMLRTATAGIDWQASERITLSLAQRWRAYSDGNHARHTSASAQAWVITQPHGRLAVLLAAERLGTDEDLDHGYYDPERYTEFGPGAVFEWHPADRWEFRFEGKVGSQKETGSDADEFHGFTTGLEFPLGSLFSVNLEGGRSNSSLSATSGFKQNRWAATLTTRF